MNYFTVELGFWFTAFYMTIIAILVASFVGRTLFRWTRHRAAEDYEVARRERQRMEMVRWFVGAARDRSYRKPGRAL